VEDEREAESTLFSRTVTGCSGCELQCREVFANLADILKLGAPKSWDRKKI